jgi:hypothetical protein
MRQSGNAATRLLKVGVVNAATGRAAARPYNAIFIFNL